MSGTHYLKARDRASFEWSIASAAVALDPGEDGTVRDVRIAVGGVATRPWRLPQVEAMLRGEDVTRTLAQRFQRRRTGGGGRDRFRPPGPGLMAAFGSCVS